MEIAVRDQVTLGVGQIGSWGSGRAAGPKMTWAPFGASNVDWWHGQRMWCVVCSYSEAGQPTWVQIFE